VGTSCAPWSAHANISFLSERARRSHGVTKTSVRNLLGYFQLQAYRAASCTPNGGKPKGEITHESEKEERQESGARLKNGQDYRAYIGSGSGRWISGEELSQRCDANSLWNGVRIRWQEHAP
jgi:hypothetical protein